MKIFRRLFIFCLVIVTGCNRIPDDVYKVVKIKDGDTIELLSSDFKNITVRLAGIDCPEKTQAYGQKAKQFTALLCFGKDVRIQGNTQDRYGRTVATVIISDGKNLNYELVRNGYAWQYKAYSHDPELARLELYARQNRLGLWQDANPVEPWNYRKTKRPKTPKAPKAPRHHPYKKRHRKTDTVTF